MIIVDILHPEWQKSIEASAVFLPGTLGEFEVLQDHAPLISGLSKGSVRWRTESGEMQSIQISGGIVKVDNNNITVCVE